MPPTPAISAQLDRLAGLDTGPFPVVSLYLNLQPDQHGRDNFDRFLRKELDERVRSYGAAGPEASSLTKDAERIARYLAGIDAAANGLALFACAGIDLFEAIPLAAPIPEHRLYIADEPHLYPLARLLDEYPRYAVLLADTHQARIMVVAANTVELTATVEGTKTRRHKMGGWSQARYQRHIENYHLHHAKEVVDTLAKIVRDEEIASVVVAGDDVIVPLLKAQLPKELSDKVVDVMKLDVNTPVHEVIEATIAALSEKDAESDRERVNALIGAYRSNGLGAAGVDAVQRALEMGQVEELVITATADTIQVGETAANEKGDTPAAEQTAGALIAKARQTGARVRFIEDPALLAAVGGVGAFLRFRL